MSTADRVIEKCGGVKKTAELAKTTVNWVYRWRLDKSQGGTGGVVPGPAQRNLIEAAQNGLCDVTPSDFF